MRTRVYLPLAIAFVLIGFCCAGFQGEPGNAPASLEGTWRLVSYRSPADAPGKWRSYSPEVIYEKYLTSTHFIWIRYEKDKDQLVGMGGGTYRYDGKKYEETIDFFMPATSSILGQTISFDADFSDGQWHHSGYAKENQFDPEQAETVVIDSVLIDEIWERIPATDANKSDLLGSWRLVGYTEKAGGPELNYPSFVHYIKLITPSHFAWVQYNEDGDDVSGAGCGTYSFDGKTYIENVKMIFPAGSPLINSSITFDDQLSGNRWVHRASMLEKEGKRTDSVYIDERWIRFR